MVKRGKLPQIFDLIDLPLLLVVIILYILGIVTIYSATYRHGFAFVEKQLINGLIAAVSLVVFFCLGIKRLFDWSYFLYGGLIFALVALLFLGDVTRGSHRWLYIGNFALQPSEAGKLILCLTLAQFLAREGANTPGRLLRVFALSGVSGVLILLEPDLGTSIVYGVITLSCLWSCGSPKKYFSVMFALGLAALPLMWAFLKDYQKLRILAFLNPNLDPLGAGYNVIQSRIAVGSGSIFGKGFLQGTQSKLQFLPEPHTDFIFGVFAEEFGFIGSLVVLALFAFLVWRIVLIALKSKDVRVKIFAGGFSGWLIFHVFESVGMSVGLMPVTGLALPFMSYGGSSLITISSALGLLLSACLDYPKRYE